MGQYHLTVNLDKREFIKPHDLGDGLKLWEQIGHSYGGVATALVALLAVSNGRGGGDFRADDPDGVVGRWGGDRLAIIGDYAEDSDLPEEFKAESIYARCHTDNEEYTIGTDTFREHENCEIPAEDHYTDISPMVRRYLREELGIRYYGDGWMKRVEMCWEHPEKVKGHLDHADTNDPFIVNRPPTMSDSEVDLHLRFGMDPRLIGITEAEAKIRNWGWGKGSGPQHQKPKAYLAEAG